MIDIKKNTAVFMMECFDIPEEETSLMFSIGVLDEQICKRILIRNEYFGSVKNIGKTDLKIELSEKYCISLSTVEKIIAKK